MGISSSENQLLPRLYVISILFLHRKKYVFSYIFVIFVVFQTVKVKKQVRKAQT